MSLYELYSVYVGDAGNVEFRGDALLRDQSAKPSEVHLCT